VGNFADMLVSNYYSLYKIIAYIVNIILIVFDKNLILFL